MEATSAGCLLSPELQASLRSAGLTLQIAQRDRTRAGYVCNETSTADPGDRTKDS